MSYGFVVRYDHATHPDDNSTWEVCLPHQCEEWEIVGEKWENLHITKKEAISQLTRFIHEATEALFVLHEAPSEPNESWVWKAD